MSQTVRVALNRPIRRLFDYIQPPGHSLIPGQRVQVPFGRHTTTGLVVETNATPPPGIELKTAGPPLEPWPALPKETLKLLTWAADYYQHPLGECLFMALPPALRRGRPSTPASEAQWWEVAPGSGSLTLPPNAHRQRALLATLQQAAGPLSWPDLQKLGFTRAQVVSLEEKEFIRPAEKPAGSPATPETLAPAPILTPAQQEAAAALPDEAGAYSATLLYGITGSGKTELYLHYLKQHLSPSDQALVLVPEINLTPQTVARFRKYFGGRIEVWHSALNDRERLETWLQVRHGEPVILVGTRSAVLLPYISLKTIVVDEEHDTSYKQGEGFRYSARDLAVFRARENHCPVILGSATPSLESLHNARTGKYQLVTLTERAGDAVPPITELLDIRSRPLQGGLSQPAISAIQRSLAAGQQVLVYVNRRGFAPVMMCFDCGHMAECPHCDTRLTYHRRDRALRCHHCGYQTLARETCPHCESEAFQPVGQGTERTEDVLTEQFPEIPVLRIDRDSTQRKGSIQRILAQINEGAPCVLVGTQMVAKGHDFHNVTLVVVVNADGGLFSVDFRAPEQMVQTLLQVSGRAGRGKLPGRVMIQTCHSDHPLLQTLCREQYPEVASQLLTEREQADLPPYRAMAVVRADAPQMEAALSFLDQVRRLLPGIGVDVWGPLPSPLARKANRHRAQLILRSGSRGRLNQTLGQICRTLETQRQNNSLRWAIDVDPLDTA